MQWTKEQMLLAGTMGAFGVGYVLTETYESVWEALKILGRQTRKRKGASVKLGGIRVTDDERVRHSHIVGSPGSGKTEALKTLIFEDIKRGRGCMIVDAKGDRELYEEVLGCAKSHAREADVALLSPLFQRSPVGGTPAPLAPQVNSRVSFSMPTSMTIPSMPKPVRAL